MFEDLGKKLANLGQNVMKKTGEAAEIASLSAKVLGKKKKINDEYAALGKAFYEAHKEETVEFAESINTINDLFNDIAVLEADIADLKAKLPETDDIFEDEDAAAEEVVEETVETVEEVAEEAAEAVEEVAEEAVEAVEEAAEEVKEETAE